MLMLASCAGGISPKARSLVTYAGPFATVQQAPDSYAGNIVMWGGRIISVETESGLTDLTVLQMDLNAYGYPGEEGDSRGRFIVQTPEFLDPALYAEGTLITVVGPLKGSETRLIGEMPYLYPVVGITEIKKWAPGGDPTPKIRFGIGIGAHL